MARSPDYLRLATSATRTLAETALERARDAVMVVDTRPKHLPLVLANEAARRCFSADPRNATLAESSLYALLEVVSASLIESSLGALSEAAPAMVRHLAWRGVSGSLSAPTELKLLDSAPGQRLVMLTFTPPAASAPDLTAAFDELPLSVLVLDRELKVTYANRSASSGIAGSLLGRSALILEPTRALHREIYDHALQGYPYRHHALEVSSGGRNRCFKLDLQPLPGGAGLVAFYSEIAQPAALETSHGESARHFQSLIENALDVVAVASADGSIQYVSSGARYAFGQARLEPGATTIFDRVHPDDLAELRAKFAEMVAGSTHGFVLQHRLRHADGSFRWFESHYVAALNNPLIKGVPITSHDIDERKRTETQLAQREEVFRLAADAVDGVIFEWDLVRGIVHRSRGLREILGIEPEDLAPVVDAWRERIHPRDVDAATRPIGLALLGGCGWTTTYRIRDGRGRYRSMLERGVVQRSADGDPVRAIGCCVDVSEIKRLTDLLAEAQRTAQMGGWEFSFSTLDLTWTEEMFRIYETTPADFVVSWEAALAQSPPDSRERFHAAWQRAEAGDGQFDLELEVVTLKGNRIWVRAIGHFEKLDGRPIRAFGSVQNIQAHKLAQMALENSTRWLKLSMHMAHMHAWRWDKERDEFEFAIADRQRTHLPSALPSMKELMGRIHPKDRTPLSRAIEASFQSRSELHGEFRLRLKGETYRSYATVARPLFDAAGAPSGFVGVTQDVTARRESEAKLRRSEQLLRTTTANTADTLMLLDMDLKVRFINRGSRGLSIEEIVGREIAELLPDGARGPVIAKLRHVLNGGEPVTFEFELQELGAEPRYFENRAVLVQDEGIGTGISISVTDITERKRLEQEILDVSSRERHTIGRDLHDGLGQELTGIALMLRSLATRFQRQFPEGAASIDEIVALVNQSIETARSLARGLLPVRTDSGGLPFALRELAARSRDLYGLVVNFRAEIWPEITLSETSASHLYRIAQEALTNAARHGRASKVDILLMVTRNTFLLRITDDGVGIGDSVKPVTGMGLKIMRYRAGMIGAKIEIGANVPHGTIVRVSGEQPARAGGVHYGHAVYGGSEYGR